MSTPFLYMKLIVGGKPVDGESTEKHFEKRIAVDGLEWEMASSHEALDNKPGAVKVKTTNLPKRVSITKAFDRSSTNLCTYLASRKQIDEAIITMVRTAAWGDDAPRKFIEITLTKGYVESVSMTASESGQSVGVKETVALSFNTMKIVYHRDPVAGARGEMPATTFELELPSVDN
jgi:type VI secretion system Hcp family effector